MVETDRMSTADFEALVYDVAGKLVTAGFEDGVGILSLPQTYPGGSPVVVRARRDRDRFVVTDNGVGLVTADRLGGANFFGRVAPGIARGHGVEYENDLMIASDVSRDWLASAIVFVATASRRAVEATTQRLAEDRENEGRERLRSRLVKVFRDRLSLDVSYNGRSTKKHNFDAMVQGRDHLTLFDLVTPHPISVATSIVKFQDVTRLEHGPRGVAVLADRTRMDTADITLISEAASALIELDADTDTLLREAA